MEPRPFRLVGPGRTQEVVDGLLRMLGPDVEYRLAHHADLTWAPDVQVTEVTEGVVFDEDGVRVIAAPTDHRPVEPTLGYRVEHEGRSVVIGGDGVPCAGLDRLCEGADMYVQTVLRDDLVLQVPVARFQETVDYHSTVVQAAATADRGNVRTLVLTHQIPTPFPGSAEEWCAIAAARFSGEIVFAEDMLTLSV
jgi:ribonuclease Z